MSSPPPRRLAGPSAIALALLVGLPSGCNVPAEARFDLPDGWGVLVLSAGARSPFTTIEQLRIRVEAVDVMLRSDPADPATERVVRVMDTPAELRLGGYNGFLDEDVRLFVPAGHVREVRLGLRGVRPITVVYPTGRERVAVGGADRTLTLTSVTGALAEVVADGFVGLDVAEPEGSFLASDPPSLGPVLWAEPTPASNLLAYVPDELLVAFADDTPRSRMDELHARLGAVLVNELRPTFHHVRLPPAVHVIDAIRYYECHRGAVDFAADNGI